MNKHCAYCENIFSSIPQEQRKPWDKVLLETSNFVVTPTIGALIEGWALIISKRHVPAMGALTNQELHELEGLTEQVRNLIEQEYGNTIVFEHGPSCEGTNFGCGIDHAHFHVVPLHVSIAPLVEKELESTPIWKNVIDLRDLQKIHQEGMSYLFILENYKEQGIVSQLKDIPSQFMRRVIANYIGYPYLYDYHKHNGRENVIATVQRLTKDTNKGMCLVK